MLIRNAYLDKLGLNRKDYAGNFVKEKKLKRFVQRWKYGFDYRDVFNMDTAFAEWLYSHMCMYREYSVNDETYSSFEFDGERLTNAEAIDRIIDAAAEYLKRVDVDGDNAYSHEEWDNLDEKLKKAGRLFLESMYYCWM